MKVRINSESEVIRAALIEGGSRATGFSTPCNLFLKRS